MALENRFVTCSVKAKVSMVGVPRLSWLGCPDFRTARSQLYRGRISVSLDATPNLHFDRLISTTFPEVVEKGRASIFQARLISTTSSESGHAVSVTKNVVDLERQFLTVTKNVVDLERYFSAVTKNVVDLEFQTISAKIQTISA